MPRGFDVAAAEAALRRSDRALARWMRRIGPIEADPRWRKPFDLVDALARAILYQQLSGKAAATIVGRIETACGSTCLDATALACIDDATLRGCGASGNKTLALRDLVRRAHAGELPSARQLARMDSEAVIAALTAVRGIGRWTAEMLLIFRLGRADVLPVDDLGIRRGIQRVDGLAEMPNAKAVLARGQAWAPHRTLASLYLWRVADLALD